MTFVPEIAEGPSKNYMTPKNCVKDRDRGRKRKEQIQKVYLATPIRTSVKRSYNIN